MPTATAVGGGGQILLQMPRSVVDPEANTSAIELFTVNSNGSNFQSITEGFDRYVIRTIPSPDRRYLLLISYATWPYNLFHDPRMDILQVDDGSLRTVTFLTSDAPEAYWLADGRFVYLSHEGGGSIGAFISSPVGDDVRRLSPPEHNVVKIFPVNNDLERIYYFTGAITRENAQGGGPAGGSRRTTYTGLYWATVDQPINDLMWDRIEDHYFHAWNLHVNDQVFIVSTNYNVLQILPNGHVFVSVAHCCLPEDIDSGDSNPYKLLSSINELNILEIPPSGISDDSEFPRYCNFTVSPDSTTLVLSIPNDFVENGRSYSSCPGNSIGIFSFAEETLVLLEGYRSGYFSDDRQLFLFDLERHKAMYDLTTSTATSLPDFSPEHIEEYLFSPISGPC